MRSPFVWGGAISIAVCALAYFGVLAPRRPQASARTYTTQAEQRLTVRLADGSRVVLAPLTTLTVGEAFGPSRRDVSLTGQAYFNVASTAKTPFLVHAGPVTAQVLGTEFVVRHYADDRDVLVAVQSGRVAVSRQTDTLTTPLVLRARMVAWVSDSTTSLASDTDLREYIEWTEGRLVFTRVTLPEVMTVVGRWYGLTFRFADSLLATHTITGEINDRYPREEVLQNLQHMLGVRMVFRGDSVTLVPAHAERAPTSRPRVPDEMRKTHMEVGR